MVITTTPSIEGKKILQYKGIVCGEVIRGVNIFKDVMAGIRDIVGGRSASYENELIETREGALNEMKRRAEIIGANAIVGVDIDYEVLGTNGGMLMVSCSGTAVIIEE
jgi:uncharacterized protein YbjQ (UPF0145 family)